MKRLVTSVALLASVALASVAFVAPSHAAPTNKSKTSLVNASVLGGAYINPITGAVANATGSVSVVETRTKNEAVYSFAVKGSNLLADTCYRIYTATAVGAGFAVLADTTSDALGSFVYEQKLANVDHLTGLYYYVNQCEPAGTVLFGGPLAPLAVS